MHVCVLFPALTLIEDLQLFLYRILLFVDFEFYDNDENITFVILLYFSHILIRLLLLLLAVLVRWIFF